MNKKNIKKHLDYKINDWLKSIEDKELVKEIQDNLIITGGAIVNLLQNEEVNDYDCYFKTKECCLKVADYYKEKFLETHSNVNIEILEESERIKIRVTSDGVAISDDIEMEDGEIIEIEEGEEREKYRPVYLSTNAITLSDQVQIVIRFYGEADEIHKNYDFIHCTSYYDYSKKYIELPAGALEAILNKELIYVGSKYPLCSILRTRKFINRGWNINAGQYLKMCLQLNELELLDLNILEDQLVGVDSLYFNQAIEQIKAKQKDEDFELNTGYLISIINKIF